MKFTGELIAFLDVDDIWMREKLEKQVKEFQKGNVAICYSNTLFFNKKIKNILYPQNYKKVPQTNSLITNYSLSLESLMISNEMVKKLTYSFDPNFDHISDFDLMIRRPPRSTQWSSSAASDVYKRQTKTCMILC